MNEFLCENLKKVEENIENAVVETTEATEDTEVEESNIEMSEDANEEV